MNATDRISSRSPALRADRHELAGAFGDSGTDLPLIVGMIISVGLDAASVLLMFGVMQILTGVVYWMPMPVQPLKAVAGLVGEAQHGMAFGVLATVNGLGDFLSNIVVGVLWTVCGPAAAFGYSAVLFAVGAGLVLRLSPLATALSSRLGGIGAEETCEHPLAQLDRNAGPALPIHEKADASAGVRPANHSGSRR